MLLKTHRRARLLFSIAALIAAMLLANAVLMYRNSNVIEDNRVLSVEAESAKVNTVDIIRNIHLLDLGIRGYALTKDSTFLSSIDSAKAARGRVLANVQTALTKQGYPNLYKVDLLRDSIEAYFNFIDGILVKIQAGNDEEAKKLIAQDRGLNVWRQHLAFTHDMNQFEDMVMLRANEAYLTALRRTYLLQLAIFILTVPAILYMALYAARTFEVSAKLQLLEHEKNRMLVERNETLDKLVKDKTRDIQIQNEEIRAQNEEIVAQNEEIRAHNEQLTWQQEEIQKTKGIIEKQASIIETKNQQLTEEVTKQTQGLREANQELIAYNNRLEQFTYIISHNLRAPLARLKGLANIIKYTEDPSERDRIFEMAVQSSNELDHVITDLSVILNIDRSNTLVKSTVVLKQAIEKVLASLKHEIEEVSAQVFLDVHADTTISCLAPYVDSILNNLVGNAIKYRDPARPLVIRIRSEEDEAFVNIQISDNGLGIDLSKHSDNLFGLYKRFHLHVEGRGLGLYLVKTQLKAIGGKIEVSSKVGHGTMFNVYFPK